ncbi:MAG TPA: glycosyl transferase [Ruminiclostridium sp.]|nr:glycosyl transferase [Ruminiclostridium sp.]
MILSKILFLIGMALRMFGAYFFIIALFSLRKTAEYRTCKPKQRFALLIPARNEETVIGELVQSLLKQDYPKELFDVYVIPNNCTDGTEAAARNAGAKIISLTKQVRCKGDALHESIDRLMQGHYDVFCVFDADNVADPQFLAQMNRAFCSGARVAKARMEAKNPYDSWIAGCYGLYFSTFNFFFNRARSNLGLSAKLVGTGFAVSCDFLREIGGWNTDTLAEDAEFSAQCALAGERVWWVPGAVTYDEEPNSFRLSMIQRRRWCSGIMQVAKIKLPQLLQSWRRDTWPRTLDFIMFLFAPFVQSLSVISLLLSFGLALAGGAEAATDLLAVSAGTAASSYLGTTLLAAAVAYGSGHRDKRIVKSVLTFPVFMVSWIPLQVLSLFCKTTKWHEIRHIRKIVIEDVA